MILVLVEAEKNIRSVMEEINKTLRTIVKGEAEIDDWEFHIQPVIQNSLILGEFYNADIHILEAAAILHDIGRIRYGKDNHPETGAADSKLILQQLGASSETTEKIANCVAKHSKGFTGKRATIEEDVIANADAMAHFDQAFYLLYFYNQKLSYEKALQKVRDILKSDWETKLNLDEAKARIKSKKEALDFLFNK